MNKTISLVMATYNGEKYIREQINSLLSQSILPNEFIIVDDGSKDDTVAIIKEMLSTSSLTYKIIEHESNAGVSQSFEDGIKASSSEYIMVCDQDDIWYRNKVELTKAALDDGVSMAVCNANIVDSELNDTGRTMFQYIELPLKLTNQYTRLSSDEMMALLLKRNYVTGMCMIGNREIMQKAIPFPETMTYDTWLAWNLANEGDTVLINESLVSYRQHGGNAIGTTKKKETIKEYYYHRRTDLRGFCEKYVSLENVTIHDKDIKTNADEATSFYKGRTMLGKENGVSWIVKSYISKKYEKYTPSVKKELLKDVGMCIWGR